MLARAVRERAPGPVLARWLVAPSNRLPTNENPPKPSSWKENGAPPMGVHFVKRRVDKANQWFRWDKDARKWVASGPPPVEANRLKQLPSSTTTSGGLDETVDTATDDTGIDKPVGKTVRDVVDDKLVETILTLKPPERERSLSEMPIRWLANLLEHLPLTELRTMQFMDTRFDEVARYVLRTRMAKLIRKTPLSSLGGNFGDRLAEALTTLPTDRLTIVSDQVTPETIDTLTGNTWYTWRTRGRHGKVEGDYYKGRQAIVYGGEHFDTRTGAPRLPSGETHGHVEYKSQIPGPITDGSSSKMHVKSMIGYRGDTPSFLETGSANFTFKGFNCNTESVVIIKATGIGRMFEEYVKAMTDRDDEYTNPGFSKRLKRFNERNPIGIRAALAPFVNVGEQLTYELKGADMVRVRMFLVSGASTGERNQPLEALCKLAELGKDVTVIVDAGQSQTGYVKSALRTLKDRGVKVFTETGPTTNSIMHDKLIFAHYPAVEGAEKDLPSPERWTVMVGSSGLTRNVINNENYENLFIIDDRSLYTELMKHDRSGARYRKAF